MDGIQILIYIAVAIIYFIIKGVNKATKPEEPDQAGEVKDAPTNSNIPNVGPPRKTGPMSFEDLMEEVRESTAKAKTQIKKPKKDKRTRSFREMAEDEDRVREATQKARELEKRAYQEKDQRKVKSYDDEVTEEYVPKYENKAGLVDYEDPQKANYEGLDSGQKGFTPFNMPTATPNLFAQLLKDPQSAKTAFIMGEIFKRKY